MSKIKSTGKSGRGSSIKIEHMVEQNNSDFNHIMTTMVLEMLWQFGKAF